MKDVRIDDLITITDSLKEFRNEKDLCDYLELNIKLFTEQVLGYKYKSYKREYYLSTFKAFGTNKPRIDFAVTLESDEIVCIECKHPHQVYAELSRALSQILCYSVIAETNRVKVSRYILLTTKVHPIICETIKKYNLPIEVVVLSKKFHAILKQ